MNIKKRGQIGYFTSVMLIFIGFAFFGIFILQNNSLTGLAIDDVTLPAGCSDANIRATWDSIFDVSSAGISIVKNSSLIGGNCAEYFANKSDGSETNNTFILYGYTKLENGQNVSYVFAEKINATDGYKVLLNTIIDIEDVAPLMQRDEIFLDTYVFPRGNNITTIVAAETEFNSIFVSGDISLLEDDFFGDESFSYSDNFNTTTINISNSGFVVGNYSYSFFSFTSKEIISEITLLGDCVANIIRGNWSVCLNNSQTRISLNSSNCYNDFNYTEIRPCSFNCVSNWSVGDWSECVGGLQIRIVNDLMSCPNATGKPAINQTCEDCTSNWVCGVWTPEICPKEGLQKRDCTDSNKCDLNSLTKPETKSCIYESNNNWIFILIILFVIGAILGILVLVLSFAKKKEDEKNGGHFNSVAKPPMQPPATSNFSKPMQRVPFVQRVVKPMQKIIPRQIQKPIPKPIQKPVISAMPKLDIPKQPIVPKVAFLKPVTTPTAKPIVPAKPVAQNVSIKDELQNIANPPKKSLDK